MFDIPLKINRQKKKFDNWRALQGKWIMQSLNENAPKIVKEAFPVLATWLFEISTPN